MFLTLGTAPDVAMRRFLAGQGVRLTQSEQLLGACGTVVASEDDRGSFKPIKSFIEEDLSLRKQVGKEKLTEFF